MPVARRRSLRIRSPIPPRRPNTDPVRWSGHWTANGRWNRRWWSRFGVVGAGAEQVSFGTGDELKLELGEKVN